MVHEYFDANHSEPRDFDPADAPGLYAIGIPRETWAEFALGDAPDAWRGDVWL